MKIKVLISKHRIFLSQRKHTVDLLNEVAMLSCKPGDILAAEIIKLDTFLDQIYANKKCYQRLIG